MLQIKAHIFILKGKDTKFSFILRCYIFLILFFMFFSGSQVYGADSQKFGEYELKAAFIFNFAKFVTWPEHHFSVRKNTIDLCVYGSGFPINTFNYFEGKTAQGQIFRTKRLKDLSAVDGCDMLFVCASERYRITQIINKVKDMPILTIGDTEGFGEKGVMINLYIEDDKVRFEINLDAAKDAGLFISSQLLKLGRIIQKKR